MTVAELSRARTALQELPKDEPVETAAPPELPADVDALLQEVVKAGAITAAEAELIAETEIEGVTLEEVARRLGVTYNAVKVMRRCRRAERRLPRPTSTDQAEILYIEMDPTGRSKRPTSGAYAAEAKKLIRAPGRKLRSRHRVQGSGRASA